MKGSGEVFSIQDVSDIDIAFPAHVKHLMPEYETARARRVDPKWERLACDWFFTGLKELRLKPREGVDEQRALRHIRAIMGSFEPKHEHKMASIAFLLEEWFEGGEWEVKERHG